MTKARRILSCPNRVIHYCSYRTSNCVGRLFYQSRWYSTATSTHFFVACVAGAKRGGGGEREKSAKTGKREGSPSLPESPFPFCHPPHLLFDACYARLLFRACLNGGEGPQVGELILSAGVKSCYVHVSRWAASHMVEIYQ